MSRMRILPAILMFGLILVGGCISPNCKTKNFHPWGLNDALDARVRWMRYTNIFMVCIYGDNWRDQGPTRYALHHFMGTVIQVYKGDWHVAEKVAFVEGLDERALGKTNECAGLLGFIFTNQHTDSELRIDTGEFMKYDSDLEPALDCVYPPKIHR